MELIQLIVSEPGDSLAQAARPGRLSLEQA